MFFKPKKTNRKIRDVKSYMFQCEIDRLVRQIKWSNNLATVRACMLAERSME